MKTSEHLGLRIRYLRTQRKWSQEDLSLESGVNKNYICDLENGRRNPSLEILEKIADAFGITLAELFRGVEALPGI